jgi:ribosomal protein L11 methyltransferase
MQVRLRVSTRSGEQAQAIIERLVGAEDGGDMPLATAVFIDAATGWQADAYFAEAPDRGRLLALIGDLVIDGAQLAIEAVPDENWVTISQAALPPVGAGRFVVHGSHDRDAVGLRHWALEIDAGEAFGTAHHATTQGCLEALDRLARGRVMHNVLDLGCGSGVLAIAAARLWPWARIAASDIDAQATAVAQANMALNRTSGRIRVVTTTGFDHPLLRRRAPYDLVVANILAGPLVRLAPVVARATRAGGIAVLSGLLGEQAREVVGAYRMAGFRLARATIDHNWATLVLVRQGMPIMPGGRPRAKRPASWPAAPGPVMLDWALDTEPGVPPDQPQ